MEFQSTRRLAQGLQQFMFIQMHQSCRARVVSLIVKVATRSPDGSSVHWEAC